MFFDTEPMWKMPDEEKIPHEHYVRYRIDFIEEIQYFRCYRADLTEYYSWAEFNGIEMEHNILIHGSRGKNTLLMFVFWTAEDAMAFKLRWS